MIIIGLLIGGVLKGQQLIENAKVTGVIQQVTAYRAAFHSFSDTYNSPPGDMRNARSRISGCNDDNFCVGGNGNSLVGEIISSGGGNEAKTQAGFNTLPQVETSMFWKHLALANLITGIETNADPTISNWGATHPSSKIRGGFHIFYSATIGDWGTGHVLRLQNSLTESAGAGGEGALALSPQQAEMIDRKMDDGMPDTGSVSADFAGTECDRGGVYQAQRKSKNCVMYFQMDG